VIVVDTSVATKWVVAEADHHNALALFNLSFKLVAPDLLLPELAYVLRRKSMRGELRSDQMHAALQTVPTAFVELIPSATLLQNAAKISEQLNHSAYDCFFFATARLRGVLVTADRVFVSKCAGGGFDGCVWALGAPWAELEAKLAQFVAQQS
jgi:predicted nucleic acid-binding protein